VRMHCEKTDHAVRIIFEDDGAGISPEDKKRLFEKGFGKNTGLGLFFIREILSITGMTITETSETGTGARFEIVAPEGTWRRREKARRAGDAAPGNEEA
ncbi:MAG: sensor histidine kinase, partial [Methanomicrobiales archaeon]|nr:sensor histidine kinase [Methanomicrobiales archaeon]